MRLPTNLNEVITAIGQIADDSIQDDTYLGIFAYVYLRTTQEIRHRIELGEFDDNVRMEKLDVEFANLYIGAFHKYRLGQDVSLAWKLSFDVGRDKLALIQHLLLGMNAHINLDLAIAASRVMDGKDIHDISADFRRVNAILADITDELQSRLGRVSPLLFLLDWIGQRSDEKVADFSISAAREFSWHTAVEMWECEEASRQAKIKKVDEIVAGIGERFAMPRTRLLKWVLSFISRFEPTDKGRIISALQQ